MYMLREESKKGIPRLSSKAIHSKSSSKVVKKTAQLLDSQCLCPKTPHLRAMDDRFECSSYNTVVTLVIETPITHKLSLD